MDLVEVLVDFLYKPKTGGCLVVFVPRVFNELQKFFSSLLLETTWEEKCIGRKFVVDNDNVAENLDMFEEGT